MIHLMAGGRPPAPADRAGRREQVERRRCRSGAHNATVMGAGRGIDTDEATPFG